MFGSFSVSIIAAHDKMDVRERVLEPFRLFLRNRDLRKAQIDQRYFGKSSVGLTSPFIFN